jgi:hypothetical protein
MLKSCTLAGGGLLMIRFTRFVVLTAILIATVSSLAVDVNRRAGHARKHACLLDI